MNNSYLIMDGVTTCQVMNSVDKKLMTISTKWSEKDVKILILREGVEPLKAEVEMRKLTEPSRNFNKTEKEYLQEVKRQLAGKDNGVEFSVRAKTLQWKKNAWRRGSIDCQSINDIIELSNLIMNSLTNCSSMEKTASDFKIENNTLRTRLDELEKRLNIMTDLKNRMEEELYKKFIVLLNSKKRKNRELRAKLNTRPTIYDESTDESEDENENTKTNSLNQSLISKNENAREISSTDITLACTSNGQSLEGFNASNNDSDESFVLQFSQSPLPETSHKKISHISLSEVESGEDLFSD